MKKIITTVLIMAAMWFSYRLVIFIFYIRTVPKCDIVQYKMAKIKSAIDEFYGISGQYPTELNELLRPPAKSEGRWERSYISPLYLYDPWGNKFIYEPNNSNPANYNITSYGADAKPGGKGENRDISLLIYKQWKLAKTEQRIEYIKELVIKIIIPGCVLFFLSSMFIKKYKTRQSGFSILTLIELIVIFVALWFFLLFSIAPRFSGGRPAPKSMIARYNLEPITKAINAYVLNTGRLPRTFDDLLTPPKGLENVWMGPYLKYSRTFDPWGNQYVYEPDSINPGGYKLISYGADGKPGGKGENADIEKFTSTSVKK
jgi:general secretion pathway protein G